MHTSHSYSLFPSIRPHQLHNNSSVPSSSSDEIINSSKTLMSIRLIEIQNQIMQRFQQYPSQQKHMLKQMFYQNIDSYKTLQQKISYLLMLIDNKDIIRLNQYIAGYSQKNTNNQTDTFICIHAPLTIQQNSKNHQLMGKKCIHTNQLQTPTPIHKIERLSCCPTVQCCHTYSNNQNKSLFKQNLNPTKSQSPFLHKYYSQSTLQTNLPNETLYGSFANSQQSEEFKNFIQLQRSRKSQGKHKRTSNLIEFGKMSQQLKLLKMTKKLSKYQNVNGPAALNGPGITQMRSYQSNNKLLSQKQIISSKNYVQMNGTKQDFAVSRSMRQNCREGPHINDQDFKKKNYELKDQFSFRQGLYPNYNETEPNLPRKYDSKIFMKQDNNNHEPITYFENESSVDQKSGIYDDFQHAYKRRQNSQVSGNSSTYETNLTKLNKLKEEKLQKQKKKQFLSNQLDQRVYSLFQINDPLYKSLNTCKSNKDVIEFKKDMIEKGYNKFKTQHSIYYSESDDKSIDSYNLSGYLNEQQSNFSHKKSNKSRQPINKSDHFKKKKIHNQPLQNHQLHYNHQKVNSNKPNKTLSKSSQSRSSSNQKISRRKPYITQLNPKQGQKQLKKQRIPFDKKFKWVKKDGDLGDLELDPSQFSDQVKQYFLKRRKSIPSLIPSIRYNNENSNQTQLVSRKVLQKSRQKQVQEKVNNKNQSLKLLRNGVHQMIY